MGVVPLYPRNAQGTPLSKTQYQVSKIQDGLKIRWRMHLKILGIRPERVSIQ